MSRLPKWLIPAFLFVCPSLVHAQSCTTATCNATDCSRNSVLAALPASSNSNATVVVNIPACPATGWTSNIAYSVSSAITSLTVQGQTTCTGSGDPAQNNLVCTDATVIVDNDTTDNTWLLNLSANAFIRVTGLTITAGSGITKNNARLAVSGPSIRLDHNHFIGNVGTNGDTGLVSIGGCARGVADHNIFDAPLQGNSLTAYNSSGCRGDGTGDHAWAQPTGSGTSDFLFVEQNLFNNNSNAASSQASDCMWGGKGVWRFNTAFNGAHFQTHPTGSAGSSRGCRATEIYGNHWHYTLPTSGPSSQTVYTVFFYSSGTALVWGNVAEPGYTNFVNLEDCRSPLPTSRCGYGLSGTPGTGGWGGCGQSPLSPWDGNTNGGYPCIDQPGRGQGDLLGGMVQNNNRIDTVTGTATWPHQKLEPLYYWLNAYSPLPNGNGSPVPVIQNGNIWTQNVDYYVSSNPNSGTDCNGFSGAIGVGCGPRSSRPSTCTAGVAWWSTDQGNWNQSSNGFGNGTLDVCTAANTWTDASYTPYTYPHPLDGGTVTPPPAPPTSVKAVVN